MEEEVKGLCNRCDHRACFIEQGHAPRCECGEIGKAVYSCYMYTPVRPVVLARNKHDRRPQFAGSMISARSHIVRVLGRDEMQMSLSKYKDGNMIYWMPKDKKEQKTEKKTKKSRGVKNADRI